MGLTFGYANRCYKATIMMCTISSGVTPRITKCTYQNPSGIIYKSKGKIPKINMEHQKTPNSQSDTEKK